VEGGGGTGCHREAQQEVHTTQTGVGNWPDDINIRYIINIREYLQQDDSVATWSYIKGKEE